MGMIFPHLLFAYLMILFVISCRVEPEIRITVCEWMVFLE